MMERVELTPRTFRRLSKPVILEDGRVSFAVETDEAEPLQIACSLAEVGDIFSFLGHLAKGAAETSGPASLPSYLAPVPAQGIGFQAGPTPEVTLLVMRLSGFDMAFEIPSSGLAAVAPELSRIATTLSAPGTSRN